MLRIQMHGLSPNHGLDLGKVRNSHILKYLETHQESTI